MGNFRGLGEKQINGLLLGIALGLALLLAIYWIGGRYQADLAEIPAAVQAGQPAALPDPASLGTVLPAEPLVLPAGPAPDSGEKPIRTEDFPEDKDWMPSKEELDRIRAEGRVIY